MFKAKRTYLDWAAAAPVTRRAARAYARAASEFGNPSSPHEEGRKAKAILESARTDIARELSMKADDVMFTSGATEANNLAIRGYANALLAKGRAPSDIHLFYLPSAHASTVETMKSLEAEGVVVEPLPIKDGEVDIERLKTLLRKETALVSMDYVCGETGTIWNTREVRRALPSSVPLHVDAAQAPLEESVERTRLGADLLVLDAQKIGGERGCGVLAAPRTFPLAPLFSGGPQERDVRPGTPSPALARAFADSLIEAKSEREAFATRARRARERLIASVSSIPNAHINAGKEHVAHILNLSLIGRDTDYLVALLDEAGFAVSTKSACESDTAAGSRAVLALTGDEQRAAATLRISWGPSTSDRALAAFAEALKKATAFLDERPA